MPVHFHSLLNIVRAVQYFPKGARPHSFMFPHQAGRGRRVTLPTTAPALCATAELHLLAYLAIRQAHVMQINLISFAWCAHHATPPLFLKSHVHAICAMVACWSCRCLVKYSWPSSFPLVCNRCILYSSGLFHLLYAGPVGKPCAGVNGCWSGVCTSSLCAPG